MNTTTIIAMPSILLPTNPFFFSPNPNPNPSLLRLRCHHSSILASSSSKPDPNRSSTPNSKPRRSRNRKQPSPSSSPPPDGIPTTIPPKPRRGRRGEAAAVEDFVRASLERTFESIRRQDGSVLEGKGEVLRERSRDEEGTRDEEKGEEEAMVVEEEREDWPLDAEIGWGVRASEYFDQHPIKNVVGEDGVEIDWEGEVDEGWVKEINCLEWESFAFHPSPLIVLVFERCNRAADNWKLLKELEKAAKVYWSAKDRLPPRTIKIDINIETDLAYALKVKECPQLLFLRGNRILYREKELRTSEELVQMIAYFYYNAKRPSCVDPAAVAFAPPF